MYHGNINEIVYPPADSGHLWDPPQRPCPKDPCEPERCCRVTPPDPCRRNCCDTLKKRRRATAQARANASRLQREYEAAFRSEVPRYALRPKPTAGKGVGCGSPPPRILPPLWMYGLGTQRGRPSVPARVKTGHRRRRQPRPVIHAALMT